MERDGGKVAIMTKARKIISVVRFHFPLLIPASVQTLSVTSTGFRGVLVGVLIMLFPQDFFLNLVTVFHSRTPR